MPVTVRDLSRTGVGIALSPARINLGASANMLRLAHRLAAMFPEEFEIDLDPGRLGEQVRRRVQIVRMRRGVRDDDEILLGCTFHEPLSDGETKALDLLLPNHNETVEELARERARARLAKDAERA